MNDKPEKRFRCSPVSASVWAENKTVESGIVKFYSISISRVFKKNKDDKNGNDGNEWQYTKNFKPEDLPKVALVAMEAYKYIALSSSNPQAEPDQ